MIVIMRAAASGKPVGVNVDQVKFIRANTEDVTAIVFGKTGEEHTLVVKGSVMQVAQDLNYGLVDRREGSRP